MNRESLERISSNPAASPAERAAALARIRELDGAPAQQHELEVELLSEAGCMSLNEVPSSAVDKFVRARDYSPEAVRLVERHSALLRIGFWERYMKRPDEHADTLVALLYDGAETPAARREIAVRELAKCRAELIFS